MGLKPLKYYDYINYYNIRKIQAVDNLDDFLDYLKYQASKPNIVDNYAILFDEKDNPYIIDLNETDLNELEEYVIDINPRVAIIVELLNNQNFQYVYFIGKGNTQMFNEFLEEYTNVIAELIQKYTESIVR